MFNKFEKTDDNAFRVSYKGAFKDKVNIYLMSDIHYDSVKCRRDLFNEHLDDAIECQAGLLINGDFFDVMQGRKDRRGSSKAIRPEYIKSMLEDELEYYDVVPRLSAKELAPKLKQLPFVLIGYGNHETSIAKHNETDILAPFIYELRQQGVNAHRTGYSGFLVVSMGIGQRTSYSYNIAHHHGQWGGIVTKGVLGVGRRHVIFPNADLVLAGHVHDQVITSTTSNEINTQGKVSRKTRWGLVAPSYKDGYGKGIGGFEVEKHVPKPLGCYRLELKISEVDNVQQIKATPVPYIV